MINFAQEYQSRSRVLKERFKRTEDKDWSIETVCLEFIVQLGHVSYVLNRSSGVLSRPFIKEDGDIADEMCDLLFQTFNLANFMNMDLSKELDGDLPQIGITLESESQIIVYLNHYIGNLCDCVLALDGYKDRTNIGESKLISCAKEDILKTYVLVYQLAQSLIREVDIAYDQMLCNTNAFLDENG